MLQQKSLIQLPQRRYGSERLKYLLSGASQEKVCQPLVQALLAKIKCLSVSKLLKGPTYHTQSTELVTKTEAFLSRDLKNVEWEQSLRVICRLFLNCKLSLALVNASLL